MMKKLWICFVGIALVATMASAQTREEELAGWLKQYPQADTNKDGTLSMQEAKAFQSKQRQPKVQKKDIPWLDAVSEVTATSSNVASGVQVYPVADASFENPLNIVDNWGTCPANWNDAGSGRFEVGKAHLSSAADGDWSALMSNMDTIYQDLNVIVHAGTTLEVSFYGGRSLDSTNTSGGGVLECTFIVDGTRYSMTADTSLQAEDTWQLYTHTVNIANTGNLVLEFKTLTGTPPPTHADVAYGSHPRNVLDLWLAPSDEPTPLLVCIHGGGYRSGDKRKEVSDELVEMMHAEGISVASINYRFKEGDKSRFEGEDPLYPAILHDGARALQFLRYNAAKYNLDKTRFAATGGSAGGNMLMWLGFHPDLAQPDHEDPVLRESSRLQALAPRGGQTTSHGPTFLEWFGVESLNLSKQKGMVQPSSEEKYPSDKELALQLDASPITHLTKDDPPIYLYYPGPNEPVDETTPWGTWVHHPMLGIKLQEAMYYVGMECYLEYKDGPPVAEYESRYAFIIQKLKSLTKGATKGNSQAVAGSALTEEDAMKWTTPGFKQSNTMGGGQATIPTSGKFRVFVLMGQSNMQGTGRANELKAPYTEKHDRIRIWANGRWEYFVPTFRFGPGVSFAHQLADFWPDDTIGIIKVAIGGTGIRGFEKNWTFERADLTYDGKKGPLYKDLMNAVAEAKRISQPEFCGFFWKQGAADGTKKDCANEYYDTFKQLVSDLRADLGVSDLPTFVPAYMKDEELLKVVLSYMNDEDLLKAKKSAGKDPVKDEELLKVVLSYLNEQGSPEVRKSGGRPFIATVFMAQNRAGRELPNVTTLYPGKLPKGEDGTHLSSEGYITLGKITASAVEEFYKAKE